MLLHITGSNKKNRKLVERAAWWYAEKLMGKRLMRGLEIHINLRRNLITKEGCEGTAIWEDDNCDRPREFTIELDLTYSIRDVLITLAHELVHVKQYVLGELKPVHNGFVFKKTLYSPNNLLEYFDQPFEIEAYGREKGLLVAFLDRWKLIEEELGIKI